MTICTPSALIYRFPDEQSECLDELLFGQTAEICDKIGEFCLVVTEYGYKGWIKSFSLCEMLHAPNATVTSPFADLLSEPRFRTKPVMTLPMGARVDAALPHEVPGFGMVVMPDRRMYYIHRSHLRFDNPGAKATADGVCAAAESFAGVQYRWGGRSFAGVDCSGLAFNAYSFNGVYICRDSDFTLCDMLKPIPLKEAKRGDLLYFKGHVAVYLGENRFIHASAKAGRVVYGNVEAESALFERFITAAELKGGLA